MQMEIKMNIISVEIEKLKGVQYERGFNFGNRYCGGDNSNNAYRGSHDKSNPYSVRCIKD